VCTNVTKDCHNSISKSACEALCSDMPAVAIHVCPYDKIKSSGCISKLAALNARESGLAHEDFSARNETSAFTRDLTSVSEMKRLNRQREKNGLPKSPAHLKDCVETKMVTLKSAKSNTTRDIAFCTKCASNSPGIPAPIFRIQPENEVLWICHTADIIGMASCKGVLERINLDKQDGTVEKWCQATEELHTMRGYIYGNLSTIPTPHNQLLGQHISQVKAAFIKEYYDYFDNERIGAVSVSAWNTARCGLLTKDSTDPIEAPKHEIESMMIVQTGVRFQSCVENFSHGKAVGASCVVQKKVQCSMRKAPQSYEKCTKYVLNPNLKLFGKMGGDGLTWLTAAPSDCTENYLSYLTVL